MDEIGVLGVFCGAASLSGILLAIHFFVGRKGGGRLGTLLGILFLAISMRVAKSVWHYIFFDYGTLGVIQGFVFLTMIGPAVFSYTLVSAGRQYRPVHYFHWLWPILSVFVAIPELISFRLMYILGTLLVFTYVAFSVHIHHRAAYVSTQLRKFNKIMLIGVFLIGCSFVFQQVLGGLRNYTYGAAFASIIIYVMLFQALSKSWILTLVSNKQVPGETLKRVKEAIETDKVFLRAGITLNGFADEFRIPAYLVTRSVNQTYARSFPETINHFRVEEVKRRLKNGDNKQLKIEGIAIESGFSTPSAFYSAFKKETGVTPTQFQKAQYPSS